MDVKKTDMNLPFISVVIATLNRTDCLVRCVESILLGGYPEYEIIIVDQGRDRKTEKCVTEKYANERRLRYYHSSVVGLSHARNVGCEKAGGEIVAYIDDDAIASPGWLAAYAEVFTKMEPIPGMAGGKILPEWEIPCPDWYPEERRFLLGLYDIGDTIREYPGKDLPPGANFALLRKVITELSGFDRRLGFDAGRKNPMIAGEDSLMALKVKDAGYSIIYHPRAKVHHFMSGYKLTKKYFLKRHVWEGRTIIQVMEYRKSLNRKHLSGIIVFQLVSILKNSLLLLTTIIKRSSTRSSKQMLRLAHISYSYGVVLESIRKWIGKLT